MCVGRGIGGNVDRVREVGVFDLSFGRGIWWFCF